MTEEVFDNIGHSVSKRYPTGYELVFEKIDGVIIPQEAIASLENE